MLGSFRWGNRTFVYTASGLQQMKLCSLKIRSFTTHTVAVLCTILPFLSHPSFWELGAAVHGIAQAETRVPGYLECLGHSGLTAVHHRGHLKGTASLQA